ncbi:MAG: membrane or secreted protein [Planctomycetaceae bacterium]
MKSLLFRCAAPLVCLLLGISSGCRHGGFAIPGPMQQQQASAVIHDPYPARDIAPYDAASRPPGYEQPLPEPVRNRIVRDSMPWLGR